MAEMTPVNKSPHVKPHSFFIQDTTCLETNLNRFWEVDTEVQPTSMTSERLECERHFTSHTTQQPDGNFTVRLPLKAKLTELVLHAAWHRTDFLPLNVDWIRILN
jgi:hypothetical protein